MTRPSSNAWDSRTSRWATRMALALGLPLAVFLVFLLAVSTDNTGQPSPFFAWLYWINFVVAGVLLLVVLALGLRLGWRCTNGASAAVCCSNSPRCSPWSACCPGW
jgi:hypothetical protein